MAHDVFISYSSVDKPIADAICANLETVGIRCWIAPRDIAPGEDWPTAISNAITQSQAMVLVFSSHSNSSDDVSRELNLAANNKLIIIPFKIENVEPEPGIKYYLSRTHWLDAMNPPTQEQIRLLTERVTKLLSPDAPGAQPEAEAQPQASSPVAPAPMTPKPSQGRKLVPWFIGGGVLVLLMVGFVFCAASAWLGRGLIFARTSTKTPTYYYPLPPTQAYPTEAIPMPGTTEIPIPPTAPSFPLPASQPTEVPTPAAPAVSVDIKRIAYFETQVLKMAWRPDSKQVILAGFDLTPYDVASQQATTPISQKILDDIAVSPDGKLFVIATTWDGIQLYDQNWGKIATLPMSTDGHSIVFTPDGKKILAAEGNLIKVWDTATQQELQPLPLGQRADALAISPDGSTLAVSMSMEIKLLTIDGEALFTLSGHGHQIFALAFSPDGKTLASGSLDNTMRLWDVATGRLLKIFSGHTGTVSGVSFSPDGKLLATSSDDTTIKVWDVSSGAVLQTLYDHTEAASSVAFSPDGTMLASGSYDKMQLWSVTYNNP